MDNVIRVEPLQAQGHLADDLAGVLFAERLRRLFDQVVEEVARRHELCDHHELLFVLELLDERSSQASICPSELARRVGGELWREWLEPVRRAGRRLAARGRVEFTQRGRTVDPATVRGPVRIRRRRGEEG